MEKVCTICNLSLPLASFKNRNRGNNVYYYPYCIECHKKKNKQYKLEHKNEIVAYEKQRYLKNQDAILESAAIYYSNNSELVKQRVNNYQLANKDKLRMTRNTYKKNRKSIDPAFKLRYRISSTISLALKKLGLYKNNSSFLQHVSYTMQELKEHLEKQFETWMSWKNYGIYVPTNWNDNDSSTWTWNIDHIVPQSKLLYTSMEDDNFKVCWMLENLRPLSSKLNRIKGNK